MLGFFFFFFSEMEMTWSLSVARRRGRVVSLPRASTNCCAPKLGRLGPDQETQVQWQTKLTPWVSISRQRFNSWGIHGYSVWLYNCYCILCVIIDCFLNGFSPAAPGIPKLSDFSEPATRQGTGAMEDVLALWKFHYLGR